MGMTDTTFDDRLIKVVQSHKCLYDRTLRKYSNRPLKERAWRDVAKVSGAGIKYCQDRWRSLRDRYVKELAKPEESRWMYFRPLSYLKSHVRHRRKFSDVQLSLDEKADTICSPEPPIKLELNNSSDAPERFRLNGPSCSANMPSGSKCSADAPLTSSRSFEEANEKLNKIMDTVTNMISTEVKKSRNTEFYVVLDGYLSKLSEEEQDALKIELLNFVYAKTKK